MSVNLRIKEVRKRLKLSQHVFSRGIYISHGYIAGIELGNVRVNDRIIELVASKYGVSRHWLVSGEGDMFDAPPPDAELERMTAVFTALKPGYKRLVLGIIRQLLALQDEDAEKPSGAEGGGRDGIAETGRSVPRHDGLPPA